MIEASFTVGAVEWLLSMIALVLMIKSSEKPVLTSGVLSVAVLVIMGGFQRYSPYLYQVAVDYPEYKQLWWVLWYFGFFLGDLLGIMAIKSFHAFYELEHELVAKVIATSYFLFGLAQLAMLVQRLQFDAQIAKQIYSISIMTISYGTLLIVLLLAIHRYYHAKKGLAV